MVPHLTRFKPLIVMAIFGTYLRAGRGSKLVWFQGPKTSPKVPPQKVLQTHFQVILSDLSLDAPVTPGCPYAPVSKRDLLDEPGAGACHPPPLYCQKSGTPWYVPLIWTQINCKVHFSNFRRVTTYIFIIINIVHMILTFKIVNTRFLMLPQWHHHHRLF